jgi:hypothetical protein
MLPSRTNGDVIETHFKFETQTGLAHELSFVHLSVVT